MADCPPPGLAVPPPIQPPSPRSLLFDACQNLDVSTLRKMGSARCGEPLPPFDIPLTSQTQNGDSTIIRKAPLRKAPVLPAPILKDQPTDRESSKLLPGDLGSRSNSKEIDVNNLPPPIVTQPGASLSSAPPPVASLPPPSVTPLPPPALPHLPPPVAAATAVKEEEGLRLMEKNIAHPAPRELVVDPSGKSVLHVVAQSGLNKPLMAAECTYLLLGDGFGVNPGEVDEKGNTAVHVACEMENAAVLEILLPKSIEILTLKNQKGCTPFQLALANQSISCLQLLFPYVKDLNERTHDHVGLIHVAAMHAGQDIRFFHQVLKFADDSLNLDLPGEEGMTSLHYAARAGSTEAVQLLLNAGANPTALDDQGKTVLHYVSNDNALGCVDLLRKRGVEVNAADKTRTTPLHIACASKNARELCLLYLKLGAHPSLEDENGMNALHHAMHGGDEKIVRRLLNHASLDPLSLDKHGASAVHHAAASGNISLIQALEDAGLEKNVRDQRGYTLLHYAASTGQFETMKELISNGFDAKEVDNHHATILHCAALSGNAECVKKLIELGVDPTIKDKDGRLALHYACQGGSVSAIEVLVAAGGDVGIPDPKGNSGIHFAAASGSSECIKLMLEFGESPKRPNNEGETPLALAVKADAEESARALVHAGAEPFERSSAGTQSFKVGKITPDKLIQWVQERYEKTGASIDEPAYATVGSRKRAGFDHIDKFSARDRSSGTLTGNLTPRSRSDSNGSERNPFRNHIQFEQVVELFNQKPIKGAKLARESLCPSHHEFVDFLFRTVELDKKQLGELLSFPGYEDVLQSFTNKLNMSGLEFDVALRLYLSKFRLPGEAQKIDRMMESFAQRFFTDNPNSVFADSDAVYMLAFSTIMLNTDAHNPAIKKERKMSKSQFVSNNRGINAGDNIDAEFLEALYDRILYDEIKLNQDNVSCATERRGYLVKQGGNIKTWKRRWFELSDSVLYYYKAEGDKEPYGIIPLENLEVNPSKENKKKFCFEILPADGADAIKSCKVKSGARVSGHHKSFLIAAKTEAEREAWIACIRANTNRSPFFALIQLKLKALKKRKESGDGKIDPLKNKRSLSKQANRSWSHLSQASRRSASGSTTTLPSLQVNRARRPTLPETGSPPASAESSMRAQTER